MARPEAPRPAGSQLSQAFSATPAPATLSSQPARLSERPLPWGNRTAFLPPFRPSQLPPPSLTPPRTIRAGTRHCRAGTGRLTRTRESEMGGGGRWCTENIKKKRSLGPEKPRARVRFPPRRPLPCVTSGRRRRFELRAREGARLAAGALRGATWPGRAALTRERAVGSGRFQPVLCGCAVCPAAEGAGRLWGGGWALWCGWRPGRERGRAPRWGDARWAAAGLPWGDELQGDFFLSPCLCQKVSLFRSAWPPMLLLGYRSVCSGSSAIAWRCCVQGIA